MAYDKFTLAQVFNTSKPNILCNQVFNEMILEYTETVVNTDFCVTGTLSKILQGDPAKEVPVIAFITNSSSMFYFMARKVSKYIGASAITLKDRVQLDYQGIYVELWLTNSIGTINQVDGINVQAVADIPANIL